MSQAYSPALHRLAAIGLLALVVGAIFAVLILPLINHYNGLRADIAREREALARFEAFSANKDAADTLAQRASAAMKDGIFLDGATDALRQANLQALIAKIAQKQGVRLASARSMSEQKINGLNLIGVQTELQTNLERLQGIILALEAHRPYLFLQSLQVAPGLSRRSESDLLRVRFEIAGVEAASRGPKP